MTAADPTTNLSAPGSPRNAGWCRGDVVALLLVLLVSLGVRIHGIDVAPSADELWHLGLSRGLGSPVGIYPADVVIPSPPSIATLEGTPSAWRVWTHMDGVLHPPLYVLVLRLWRDVFGPGIPAAHALSLVWGTIAIGFVFATARLSMDRLAGVFAGLLMAIAPMQVFFAQEIRGYEMMIALGAIILWVATRLEVLGPTPRRAVMLGLLSLPLLLTHYFAAGSALGIALYGIARLRGRTRIAFITSLIIAGGIYAVAWVPFAIRQLASLHTGDAFTKVPEVDFFRELSWAAAIPGRLFLERPWLSGSISGGTCSLFGLVVLAAPWYLRRRLPAMLPWACWTCGTLLALVALDLVRSTFLVLIIRYAAAASPAVVLLVVATPRAFDRRAMIAICSAGLLAMTLIRPLDGGLVADSPRFSETARWLAKTVAPGDAILVMQGRTGEHTADLVMLTLAHEPGLFPKAVVKVQKSLTPEVLEALPDRAWAVVIDREDPVARSALRSATLLESNRIPGEGMCDLYDLRTARMPSTRPSAP